MTLSELIKKCLELESQGYGNREVIIEHSSDLVYYGETEITSIGPTNKNTISIEFDDFLE